MTSNNPIDFGPKWDELDATYRGHLISSADFVVTHATAKGGDLDQSAAISQALKMRRDHLLEASGVSLTDHAAEWHEAIIRRIAEGMFAGTFPRMTDDQRDARDRRCLSRMIMHDAAHLMEIGLPRDDALSQASKTMAEAARVRGYNLDELRAEADLALDADN